MFYDLRQYCLSFGSICLINCFFNTRGFGSIMILCKHKERKFQYISSQHKQKLKIFFIVLCLSSNTTRGVQVTVLILMEAKESKKRREMWDRGANLREGNHRASKSHKSREMLVNEDGYEMDRRAAPFRRHTGSVLGWAYPPYFPSLQPSWFAFERERERQKERDD